MFSNSEQSVAQTNPCDWPCFDHSSKQRSACIGPPSSDTCQLRSEKQLAISTQREETAKVIPPAPQETDWICRLIFDFGMFVFVLVVEDWILIVIIINNMNNK